MDNAHAERRSLLDVVCAIDYSAASRTALRYAAAAAGHLHARLTVVSVTDPLLVEATQVAGHSDWQRFELDDLKRFCRDTIGNGRHLDVEIAFDVRAGRAADEILATAERVRAHLIVMGCHGLTGARKMFFGSTAERVLRDTSIPVLVTPADAHAPVRASDSPVLVRHVLVPVDLADAAEPLARIGAQVGASLGVPVLLVPVVEPVALPGRWRGKLPSLENEARARADVRMSALVARTGHAVEPMIVVGEPSEEIGNVADVRGAGLIVMGLQERESGRVGVIAYRILSRARVPVLAIPAAAAGRLAAFAADAA
jgi:nucleotide-binding universal stress UspA family protein